MGFTEIHQPPLFQGPLGAATVSILGASGLRLNGLTSFHLDEGPDFAWLNIYRTLANARQLEITRERTPAEITAKNGAVEVRWAPCDDVQGALSATYRMVPEAMAVDATFAFESTAAYRDFELFIANYFTPQYAPRFAIQDNRTHPEGLHWYEKQWYGGDENESWARDEEAEAIFRDGRWQTGYPLNWRRGPCFFHPLTLQEHRYGHAIVLMTSPRDCFGLSGYHTYHNAQYFHLFGCDIAVGQRLSATIRMVLLTEWDDLAAEALVRYHQWIQTYEK